jgi:hypothetical protein
MARGQRSRGNDSRGIGSLLGRPSPPHDDFYGARIRKTPSGPGPWNEFNPPLFRNIDKAFEHANAPLDLDYDRIAQDVSANRQLVGTVPVQGGMHIPASLVDPHKTKYGYFWDKENQGKTYFQTNPEFKTFFPYDPDYSALASLNKFQETGGDIFDLTSNFSLPENIYDYEGIADPARLGGVYRTNTADIGLNLYDQDQALKNLLHETKHHWTISDDHSNEPLSDQFDTNRRDPLHPEITMMDFMWNPDEKVDPYSMFFPSQALQYDRNLRKMHRIGKEEYLDLGFNRGGIVSLML